MTDEHLLTFEHDDDNQLFINTDIKGLSLLIEELQAILKEAKEEKNVHLHLFSESWGGQHLTEEVMNDKHTLIHHVKVYCNTEKYPFIKGDYK